MRKCTSSPVNTLSSAVDDVSSRLKMSRSISQESLGHTDTTSPTNIAISLEGPSTSSSSSLLHTSNLLNDINLRSDGVDGVNDCGTGNAHAKHKSAFLPYRPQTTVLTNLQRGNTEATFCPAEVKLSFHERAGQGEITAEQVNIEKLKCVDFKDNYGFTPLHWASYYGQLAAVQLLVKAGANVNAMAPEMVTPLLLAASGGHHDVVRYLLETGANQSHMDIVGNTALMYAAAGNHPHTCNELLSKDPDMSVTNENGDTAYSLAVEYGAILAQAVLEQYLTAILSL